jgi:hypothetical protein
LQGDTLLLFNGWVRLIDYKLVFLDLEVQVKMSLSLHSETAFNYQQKAV